MKILLVLISNKRARYTINCAYNILYWSNGQLLEVRLKITKVTEDFIEGDVLGG